MVDSCERRILEFPLDMEAPEVAKQLKREVGMLGRQIMQVSFFGSGILRIGRVRGKARNLRDIYRYSVPKRD
jgi:hypothetical protein